MFHDDLPERVLLFLDKYIDSVELLRVLLLLYSTPDKVWTKNEITNELRSTDASISKRLDDLYNRGVLISPKNKDLHLFAPVSDELKKTIIELDKINKTRSFTIIDAIYSRSNINKIRAFADAFVVRGDKK